MLQKVKDFYNVRRIFSMLQKVKDNPFYNVRRIFTMLEGFLQCWKDFYNVTTIFMMLQGFSQCYNDVTRIFTKTRQDNNVINTQKT